MTTITKERAEIKSFITGFLSDPAHDNQSSDSLLANVFRIALASLEAEPVAVNDDMAYAFHHALSDSSPGADEVEEIKAGLRAAFANVTTQPAPVVPEFETWFNSQESGRSICSTQIRRSLQEISWNACRAAMLHAGNFREISETSTNSPGTPDGWISCSERMPAQDDWILIYSKHGEYMAGQVQGEYVELSDGTLSWLGNALYWMPLPEPPQEVK